MGSKDRPVVNSSTYHSEPTQITDAALGHLRQLRDFNIINGTRVLFEVKPSKINHTVRRGLGSRLYRFRTIFEEDQLEEWEPRAVDLGSAKELLLMGFGYARVQRYRKALDGHFIGLGSKSLENPS